MASQPENDQVQEAIHFKDAVGRKFEFPFEKAKEYQSAATLIKEAFVQVDVLGPHVIAGHFDLLDAEKGAIILPSLWKDTVRPGMSIIMTMWPVESVRPRPPLPKFRHFGSPPPGKGPLIPASRPPPPSFNPPIVPSTASADANVAATDTAAKEEVGKSTSADAAPRPPNASPQGPEITVVSSGITRPKTWSSAKRSRKRSKAKTSVRKTHPLLGSPADESSSDDSSSSSSWKSYSSSSGSDSDSDYERTTRAEAAASGLVGRVRRRDDQRGASSKSSLSLLGPSPMPVERNEFVSAWLLLDDIEDGPYEVELERRGSSPPSSKPREDEKISWLNASRAVMDFNEFKDVALNDTALASNPDNRRAMEALFKELDEKKLIKGHSGWLIQPGTVMRYDVDSGGETVASVTFASIPQVQVDSFVRAFKGNVRRGTCPPRRLHEVLDPHGNSLERDKNQLFRQQGGLAGDDVLWVNDTWILIVDSVGVLTYGDARRKPALHEGMHIRDRPHRPHYERVLDVTTSTPGKVHFQVPMTKDPTYFELQSSIKQRLRTAVDSLKLKIKGFEILDSEGELLTAQKWDSITTQRPSGSIPIKIRFPEDYDYSSSTDSSSDDSWSSYDSDSDGSDFGIVQVVRRKISSRKARADTTPAELNRGVPPFLGWGASPARDGGAINSDVASGNDFDESLQDCLVRSETKFLKGKEPAMQRLFKKYPHLEFSAGQPRVEVEQVEKDIQALTAAAAAAAPQAQGSGPQLKNTSQLYRDYMLAAIRVLEAFVPKTHSSLVLSWFYDGLSEGAQYLGNEAQDADSSGWVVLQPWMGLPECNSNELGFLPGPLCDSCARWRVYDSVSQAVDHLREKHFIDAIPTDKNFPATQSSETQQSGPKSDEDLQKFLVPLSRVASWHTKEDKNKVLISCRKTLVAAARQCRDLQDGVLLHGNFQNPGRGVPPAFLKTFQRVITLARAVPQQLKEIERRNQPQGDRALKFLKPGSAPPPFYDRGLCNLTSDIYYNLTRAHRALVKPPSGTEEKARVEFFTSMGPHCLAAQMISNILEEPGYNNMNVVQLYGDYLKYLNAQLPQNPSKHQAQVMRAIKDDLLRLAVVVTWQLQALKSLRKVGSASSHIEPFKTRRENTVGGHLLRQAYEKATERLDLVEEGVSECDELLEDALEGIDDVPECGNHAIPLSVVVSMVFLPVSFVAMYLSWSKGSVEEAWPVATYLAIAIGFVCVMVAWQAPHLHASWIGQKLERFLLVGSQQRSRVREEDYD